VDDLLRLVYTAGENKKQSGLGGQASLDTPRVQAAFTESAFDAYRTGQPASGMKC